MDIADRDYSEALILMIIMGIKLSVAIEDYLEDIIITMIRVLYWIKKSILHNKTCLTLIS